MSVVLDFVARALPCSGMIRQAHLLNALAASAMAFASLPAHAAGKPAEPLPQGNAAPAGGFGFDVTGMDRSVSPGDDFYGYANGGWNTRTEIPADQARWGAFNQLLNESEVQVRDVLETAAGNAIATGSARQAGDMYAIFLDDAAIEARGTAPLRPDLARIAGLRNATDISALLGWISRAAGRGGIAPVGVGVGVDARNPDIYTVSLGQGGLGLPDRDYYLDAANPRFAAARAAYQDHIGKMLALAGLPGGAEQGAAVLALETQLARVMWSREERRDPDKTYNPTATTELATRYPGIDWPTMLGLDSVVLALVVGDQAFRADRHGVQMLARPIVNRALASLGAVELRNVERGHPLFGSDAEGVRSEALVRIDSAAPLPYGLLILGQHGSQTLDTPHGANLLLFLGQSLAAMIRRWTMTDQAAD